MLCYTTSPYRLIPLPIKQSRILMNCVVAIVNLGKIYKCVAATFVTARTLPENSCFPTSSDCVRAKKWRNKTSDFQQYHVLLYFLDHLGSIWGRLFSTITPDGAQPLASSTTSATLVKASSTMTLLHQVYAEQMKNNPYGIALYHPESNIVIRPGMCGYLNNLGRWNPVVDLTDEEELRAGGYILLSGDIQKAPRGFESWGPKCSMSVNHRTIDLSVGAS
jgi:hypothetical protein